MTPLPPTYHPAHDRPARAAAALEVPLRFCFQRETDEMPLDPGLPEDPPGHVQEILGALVHTAAGTVVFALEACPSPATTVEDDHLLPVQAAPGMVPHKLGTELRLRLAPLEAAPREAVYYVDMQPLLSAIATQFLETRTPAVALVR